MDVFPEFASDGGTVTRGFPAVVIVSWGECFDNIFDYFVKTFSKGSVYVLEIY